MKTAFYYHIPVYPNQGKLFIPSYLGVFIDSLASFTETLYIVLHEANSIQALEADYSLKAGNIIWVNLGYTKPAWLRTFFPSLVLKNKISQIEDCEAFIVRSPTPLAPHFHKYTSKPKIYFMVVGDYLEGAEHLKFGKFRDRIIFWYLKFFDGQFTRQIRKTEILVNSLGLFEKYENTAKSIQLIKTTTLSSNDFWEREDTCENTFIDILYTGRIDPAKGLFELVEAIAYINKKYENLRLNIVGWENNPEKPVENSLKVLSNKLGIIDKVIFHGAKPVGPQLFEMYRMADIYCIPSYHEGFPRTIWEAMANSLPVIATSVGGIPKTLSNMENAILINPKSIIEITNSIIKLIEDKQLRKNLIKSGRQMAMENTLEKQNQIIIDFISK